MVCSCLLMCGVPILLGLVTVVYFTCFNKSKKSISKRHVLIVGASSGIGRSTADYAVQLGANVTMIARDPHRLRTAAEGISSKYNAHQRINTLCFDVTSGPNNVRGIIKDAEDRFGPVYMLINCAGTAICGRLEDVSEDDIDYLTNLNYLGSLWMTRAILPSLKERGEGSIVFVASSAALLSIYGYSAYGATKWGIRGLGEALIMETVGTGVTVTLSFPPDTDTPGFANEEASKPQETKIISGSGGLYPPETVAKQIVNDAMEGKSYSTIGFEGWMLITLCGTANTGVIDTIIQSMLMGPLRIILLFYQFYFQHVIKSHLKEKNINKREK